MDLVRAAPDLPWMLKPSWCAAEPPHEPWWMQDTSNVRLQKGPRWDLVGDSSYGGNASAVLMCEVSQCWRTGLGPTGPSGSGQEGVLHHPAPVQRDKSAPVCAPKLQQRCLKLGLGLVCGLEHQQSPHGGHWGWWNPSSCSSSGGSCQQHMRNCCLLGQQNLENSNKRYCSLPTEGS